MSLFPADNGGPSSREDPYFFSSPAMHQRGGGLEPFSGSRQQWAETHEAPHLLNFLLLAQPAKTQPPAPKGFSSNLFFLPGDSSAPLARLFFFFSSSLPSRLPKKKPVLTFPSLSSLNPHLTEDSPSLTHGGSSSTRQARLRQLQQRPQNTQRRSSLSLFPAAAPSPLNQPPEEPTPSFFPTARSPLPPHRQPKKKEGSAIYLIQRVTDRTSRRWATLLCTPKLSRRPPPWPRHHLKQRRMGKQKTRTDRRRGKQTRNEEEQRKIN